jgi:hypothetical protein
MWQKIEQGTPYQQGLNSIQCFHVVFVSAIILLAEETNRYHHQYLNTLDNGPSPLSDVTETEMFVSGDYCSNVT